MHKFFVIILSICLAFALLVVVFGNAYYHLDTDNIDSKLTYSRNIYYAPNYTNNYVSVQTIDGIDYFVGSVGYSYSPYDIDVVGVLLWVYPKGQYDNISDFVRLSGANGIYETYYNLSIVPSGWDFELPFNDFDFLIPFSDILIYIDTNGVVKLAENRDNILNLHVGLDYFLTTANQVFDVQNKNRPFQDVNDVSDVIIGVFYEMPNWLYGYFSGLLYYVLGVKL